VLLEVALILPAVNPEPVPVILVPTNAVGVSSAGDVNEGLVARTTLPVPVVVAADIAVPLPCKMPVTVVVNVKAGVVVGLVTVPANPFALTKEKLDTVPTFVAAIVIFVPKGVIVIPLPGTRVSAPVSPFKLDTPLEPPPPSSGKSI
jgi:hypothetical protein